MDKDMLRGILVNYNSFKIHGFDVDRESIRMSGKLVRPSYGVACHRRDFADKHHTTVIFLSL